MNDLETTNHEFLKYIASPADQLTPIINELEAANARALRLQYLTGTLASAAALAGFAELDGVAEGIRWGVFGAGMGGTCALGLAKWANQRRVTQFVQRRVANFDSWLQSRHVGPESDIA